MTLAGNRSRFRLWLALGLVGLLLAVLVMQQRSDPPPTTSEQSFAGLGDAAEGYAEARPGVTLRFPEDHGAHPDFRIEWWYLTANLEDSEGEPLGIQWTLFRQALAPPDGDRQRASESPPDSPSRIWSGRQLWMAHAALSTAEEHFVAERFARGMTHPDEGGQAGVVAEPFAAWLDHWRLESRDLEDAGGFDRLRVSASDSDDGRSFGYRLELNAEGPLVLHGEAGFSQKSADGQGSLYYSQPFLRVEGEVEIDGQLREVSGRAWLDREWSSQLLGPNQQGWDWFSLHLEDGAKLMAFRLRGGGEGGDDYLSGSWIEADGEQTALSGDDLALAPLAHDAVNDRRLPTQWRLQLPERDLEVTVTARHPERWMDTAFPYWEGDVIVEGSHSGEGYLEMTGY